MCFMRLASRKLNYELQRCESVVHVLTFLFLFLSSDGVHPFLFLLCSLSQEHEPFILRNVVHFPAIDHGESIAVEISYID